MIKYINTSEAKFLTEKNIFRVMKVSRAMEIFQTKDIPFLSPSKWPDPYEKAFLHSRVSINSNPFELPNKPIGDPLQYNLFCQCWSAIQESEAFWNVYTSDKDGIRISMETLKMIEYLDTLPANVTVYISKVLYLDVKDLNDKTSILEGFPNPLVDPVGFNIFLLSRKRNPFRYEDEYRIFVLLEDRILEDVKKFHFDPATYVKNIRLHPSMNHARVLELKAYFENNYPTIKVTQSRLNTGPKSMVFNL